MQLCQRAAEDFHFFLFFFCNVSIPRITERWKTVTSQAKVEQSDKTLPKLQGPGSHLPPVWCPFSWKNKGNITKVKKKKRSQNCLHPKCSAWNWRISEKDYYCRVMAAYRTSSLNWFRLLKWQHIQFVTDGSDNLSPSGKDWNAIVMTKQNSIG